MTHRLQDSTRLVATATCGAAVVAIVDVLDRHGATAWAMGVAALLVAGALVVARLRQVSLEVGEDTVVVRNVLSTHRVAAEEVAEVRPGHWRSVVVLADGREIPTLLRDRDFAATNAPAGALLPAG